MEIQFQKENIRINSAVFMVHFRRLVN